LRKGSLVVNSSQGGGTKDTWVVDEPGSAAARRHAQPAAGLAIEPVPPVMPEPAHELPPPEPAADASAQGGR
jgi:hypothetical protein